MMSYSFEKIRDHDELNYEEIWREVSKNKKYRNTTLGLLWSILILTFIGTGWMIYNFHGAMNKDPSENVTTDLATTYEGTKDVTTLHGRFVFTWSLAIGLYRAASFGISLYGAVSACKQFHESGGPGTGLLCVFGAAATAVTIGGRLYETAQFVGNTAQKIQIGNAGIQAANFPIKGSPVKRESYEEAMGNYLRIIDEANEEAGRLYGMNHTFHGMVHKNCTRNGHMVPEGHESWPVFQLVNHHGHTMHHMAVPSKNGTFTHRMGHTNPNRKRNDGVYDDEYFSSGGFDFTAFTNRGIDKHHFNTGDAENVESELQCAIPDPKNTYGFDYQILDRTSRETIGSGAFAPFSSGGKTELGDREYCPSDLPTEDCGTKNSSD